MYLQFNLGYKQFLHIQFFILFFCYILLTPFFLRKHVGFLAKTNLGLCNYHSLHFWGSIYNYNSEAILAVNKVMYKLKSREYNFTSTCLLWN